MPSLQVPHKVAGLIGVVIGAGFAQIMSYISNPPLPPGITILMTLGFATAFGAMLYGHSAREARKDRVFNAWAERIKSRPPKQ